MNSLKPAHLDYPNILFLRTVCFVFRIKQTVLQKIEIRLYKPNLFKV